eukprot:2261457-Amphidinium_carterae.1
MPPSTTSARTSNCSSNIHNKAHLGTILREVVRPLAIRIYSQIYSHTSMGDTVARHWEILINLATTRWVDTLTGAVIDAHPFQALIARDCSP